MKLLVDIVPFDRGKSGISAYARNVVRALAAEGHELVLLAERDFELSVIAPGFRAEVIRAPWWTRSAALSMLWHLLFASRLVAKSGAAACLLLAANRRAFLRYPIPTVAVIHDLSQYHVDAKYDALRMLYIKRILPVVVRRATVIVAISESTKRDLVDYWKIPADRIRVVYDGFTPLPPTGPKSDGTILYVSRLEHPGKNHVGLIEAYGRLPRELAERHHLALVGGEWNGAEAIYAAAKASPYRDFIDFYGFVLSEDMPAVWSDAAVYVFPSRFEGFGLSLLEAMSAGIPCACSKTSSLGELGACVAELFDPESPEEIAGALTKLLTGDNTARLAAGYARAKEFSWGKCARELLAGFRPAEVFDVPIDCVSMSDAVEEVVDSVSRSGGTPGFYAFVNAHCLNVSVTDDDYRWILQKRCRRVWPDGRGVKMAGDILGFPVPENVNGTDLFPALSKELARYGRSVFFFGGRPGVAEASAANVAKAYPGLRIAGFIDGFVSTEAALAAINAASPDVLLVALGVPLQEKWIDENLERLNCRAVLAVGGLLDFLSGRHPRAPLWMREHGLEWLHRLACEPVGKFRRYVIGNPLFLRRVRREAAVKGVK